MSRSLASLLGALGLVLVLFGLLSLLLGLFGAATRTLWIQVNFVAGVFFLLTAAVLNFQRIRERLLSSQGRRVGVYGTSAVAQTAILLAIFALLGFLSHRYPWRYDVSENQVHSLSPQTQKVLAALDRDVRAVAFFPTALQGRVRPLLDRYQYASERFAVEYADPNTRPELVEKFDVAPEKLERGVLHLRFGDDAVEVAELSEEKITNALLQLNRPSDKKVYFVYGHGERASEGETSSRASGYARCAEALRNENYQVETLLLATRGDVPEDADAVILPGPTRPLLEIESRILVRYLAAGGSLLVTLDPRSNTDIGSLLTQWGVDVGDDIVVDGLRGLMGQLATPIASQYGDHPITRELRELTMFHWARSVRPLPGGGGRFTELVRSSQRSWAERDIERLYNEGKAARGEDDPRGPIPLAVAGTPAPISDRRPVSPEGDETVTDGGPPAAAAGARLVVFGDTDFAANRFLGAYSNRDLFVNAVNWLLGDVDAISIRPVLSRASRLTLSQDQFRSISALSLFALPEAIMLVGVFVWWQRRRATD